MRQGSLNRARYANADDGDGGDGELFGVCGGSLNRGRYANADQLNQV